MKKRFAITVLALALTAGSAMTSFAAGFTGTGKGVKYQWGDGAYCTNNWVQYKNHWFYFGDDQLMRTGWIQKDGTPTAKRERRKRSAQGALTNLKTYNYAARG